LQFDEKETWFLIAVVVWLVGLLIWRAVDRSMVRIALVAISEDEDSAAVSGHGALPKQRPPPMLPVPLGGAACTRLRGPAHGTTPGT